MITYDFTSRVAIVTGGTRGIGRGIAEALLKAGATVIATYAGNDAAAETFKQENAEHADQIELRKFDAGDYASAEAFFKELDETYDKIDILVNNAGIRRDSVVGMMPAEDWTSVLSTNLDSAFNMSKFAVHKMMSNRYGRIICITSPSGKLGFAGQANYAAAKAGQVAFVKSLSKEVAKRKITVNCVSPGFIDTDFISDLPQEQLKQYKKSVPTKRFGTTAEVAEAVLFLASENSAYITGATLEVTGGL